MTKVARESIKSTPRPRDRKATIVSAARTLFADKGYAAVSAEEIAAQVGITAGALYRHFDGKQDLLVHGLTDALDAAAEEVRAESRADLDGLVGALLRVATANRELGALWGCEIRYLDLEHRAVVRTHFFETFTVVHDRLAGLRPELGGRESEFMTWSLLASLTSVAYHRELLTPAVTSRLHETTVLMCRTSIAPMPSDAGESPPAGVDPTARREVILTAAAELFHRQGFLATSMSELGDHVGLTGAAIYRYFPTKAALLGVIVGRTIGALQIALAHALASAADDRDALSALVDAYVAFAMQNPRLIDLLLWEVRNLPGVEGVEARRAQREYIAEWVGLLRRLRPQLSKEEARALVSAALTVINDAVRTASLRVGPSLPSNLGRLGRAMLLDEHDAQRS